jgi:molybdopterin/thiamine biosynthesis adenylyltransferase/rhodanese-related sulfurtransferase
METLIDKELQRYNRQIKLEEIGIEGQQKLKNASILVVGSGGLGCPTLQYLTAVGIGKIGIVDHDVVEESNLQRQILFSTNDIGKPKATIAKQKLLQLNPFIEIISYECNITKENAESIISDYELVIDGSDNFPTRYLLNDACVIQNKPLVFGSIFKFEGSVSVFNYKDGPTYRCLFPNPPLPDESPSCGEVGVMGVLPGIVGALQANEAIKLVTGIGTLLSGKLLSFNTLTMEFSTFSFKALPENKTITSLQKDYEAFCGIKSISIEKEITQKELEQIQITKGSFQFIDVRSYKEYAQFNIGGLCIPLEELEDRLDEIPSETPTILICLSGVRSQNAFNMIKQTSHSDNLYCLKGGINAWKSSN